MDRQIKNDLPNGIICIFFSLAAVLVRSRTVHCFLFFFVRHNALSIFPVHVHHIIYIRCCYLRYYYYHYYSHIDTSSIATFWLPLWGLLYAWCPAWPINFDFVSYIIIIIPHSLHVVCLLSYSSFSCSSFLLNERRARAFERALPLYMYACLYYKIYCI